MAAQLVRLKLTLMANAFRRSAWQTIGFVLGSLYGLTVVGLVVVGMIALGTADPALAGAVVVLGGALAVLGWWIVPLFAFGVDATLDPQRFVLFGIPQRRLLAGLAAAGVVSVPGIATALSALGVSFAWWRTPLAVVAALVGAVLALALCVVGSRATTTALAPLLESRRYREVVTIAAFVPLMLVGPALGWIGSQLDGTADADAVRGLVVRLAGVVAWTPFGAPWGLGAAVHDGAWGVALGRLVVALATLAVAWVVWDRCLARALVTPPTSGAGGRAKGLGLFSRFPATPTGAVAARTATYWLRDPRYSGSIAVVPLIPVVLLAVGGGPGSDVFLVLGPITGWILGFAVSADIAYDHTAFALHVSTGVRGRADRWGRALPVLVGGVPVTVLFAVVSVWVAGRWDALPAVLGAAVGLLLVSLGVSSAVSARLLYPVPKPGDSPFKSPQGAAVATMVAQSVAMVVVLGLSLPVLVPAVLAIVLPSVALGWVSLLVGAVLGAVVLVVGVRWGARVYDRRAPELLQRVLSYA
jgi:ABC-2 type transport system permease protein